MRAAKSLLAVLLVAIGLGGVDLASAQDALPRYEIHFPDLPGYRMLACDFHMHTVFSDAEVWPPVRVDEAWRQGLSAMAISDHIEYQPHKADVPTNHNRPYELAQGAARAADVLLVKAAELTRSTPPGHFNAIFLEDIDALDTPELLDAVQRANAQGAFVMWNHQGWQGPEKGRWLEFHTTIYEKKWLHGMEIANDEAYYPEAHKWGLEKNLTLMGSSDIHHPDVRVRSTSDSHRTVTLVFAKERTAAGVKEALMAGRTVVWYKDQLIGKEELLRPFFDACIRVSKPNMRSGNTLFVEIRNHCDADIRLKREGKAGPPEILLPAMATSLLRITAPAAEKGVELRYAATNFFIAPEKPLPVTLAIPAPAEAPDRKAAGRVQPKQPAAGAAGAVPISAWMQALVAGAQNRGQLRAGTPGQ